MSELTVNLNCCQDCNAFDCSWIISRAKLIKILCCRGAAKKAAHHFSAIPLEGPNFWAGKV